MVKKIFVITKLVSGVASTCTSMVKWHDGLRSGRTVTGGDINALMGQGFDLLVRIVEDARAEYFRIDALTKKPVEADELKVMNKGR